MPVAGALIGAAASIGGGLLASSGAKSAANKAAAAQTAAAQMQIDEQRRQYDQTRSDLEPWMETGQSALVSQADLLGLNGPEKQTAAIAAQKSGPLYQSLFRNGVNTTLANASATGGLRGGNTEAALYDKGQDTLAAVIQSQLANLGGVSQQGQNAAAQVGTFGANAAGQIGQALGEQGAAQAGAATAAGAANAALIKDITGTIAGIANNKDVQNWAGKLF